MFPVGLWVKLWWLSGSDNSNTKINHLTILVYHFSAERSFVLISGAFDNILRNNCSIIMRLESQAFTKCSRMVWWLVSEPEDETSVSTTIGAFVVPVRRKLHISTGGNKVIYLWQESWEEICRIYSRYIFLISHLARCVCLTFPVFALSLGVMSHCQQIDVGSDQLCWAAVNSS